LIFTVIKPIKRVHVRCISLKKRFSQQQDFIFSEIEENDGGPSFFASKSLCLGKKYLNSISKNFSENS